LLVAAVGMRVIGIGLYQIYAAYHAEFERYLELVASDDGEHE
jgi:hypothetical protein